MADRGHGGAERDTEDTDELLYTDLNDNSSVSGLDSPLKLDPCELLLDAIDAQLGQLQIQPKKDQKMSYDCNYAAPLRWSQSLSKDTGFGSTTQTNDTPMSCLDLIHTPTTYQTSETSTCYQEAPVTHEETKQKLDRKTRDKQEIWCHREQVIWRLQRLLGDTCNEGGMAEETQPSSDSICTEDFARRFREVMVELVLPASNTQQLEEEEEAESTVISYYDFCQSQQRGHSSLNADTKSETATAEKSRELERSLCGSYGVQASCSEKAGEGFTLQRLGDEGSRWRSLIQSVTGMEDYRSNQSDYDTPRQEESEPQSTSGQRSSGNIQNRRTSTRKAQRKRETNRLVCSLGDNDTDEEMNDWSRRCRPERKSKKMQSDWFKMEERLSTLRQKCEEEEKTLQRKKAYVKDVELSLSELQQRKKHALQELDRLSVETAKMEKQKSTLEFILRGSRAGKDYINCQLHELQRQRETCMLEATDMEELSTLSHCKQTLMDGAERPGVVMSVLEREEMERQLDNAKTELFAEQRHAREKLESLQEKLEETHEELQRVMEAEGSLRNRCASLEEKQRQKKDQIETIELQVGELQGELGECKSRLGTQEKLLAQKELQLLDFHEQRGALQAERDGLRGELQHLKTQHCSALKEAHEQTHRLVKAALKQQKNELALAHEQQIQKVKKQTEEEKASALEDQALFLTRHTESLKSSIQLKEEEVKKLRDSLEQQQEEAKHREEELHVETSEKVHKAIVEERRKWEAEKMEAVQVHCGILEEQNRQSLASVRSEMQREKSKALTLQRKVVELKTRVTEMDSEICAQQREQESLLAAACKSLKEEHQAELQTLQRQMAQESQRAMLPLEQGVQLAEKEADKLRVMLKEKESSHHQITAELDTQLRHWAQELSGDRQNTVQLPHSRTAADALTNLRTLREQMKLLINHLQQELDSQKQTTEQLAKDKEGELSIQRQQLRMERDQALDSLKERLIQEHIEELSSLKWPHTTDGGADGGGVAAFLRKQLKAKDQELRQVQRSMGQWKERTAARLACKFEEELTAELERCKTRLLMDRKPSKPRERRQRTLQRPEGEMTLSAKEAQTCSASLHVVDSAASHSPSDVASFKLVRYLQSRVKQLRVENQAYTWSLLPSTTIPLDSTGSYLSTITQGQDVAGSHSSIRTVSS